MFERFIDRARRVVVLARDEARGPKHSCTGTERLLLGLISGGEGVAAKALKTMEIKGETVRTSVIEIIGEDEKPAEGHIPFTPRAKHIFELSLRETLQLGHNYIGMEHLLLGLLREGEGVTAQALTKRGVDLIQVRQTIIRVLSGYQHGDDEGHEFVGTDMGGSGGPERSNSAILEQFSRSLTQAAHENKLDPVIDRRAEMERIMQVLSRRTKNNPVLIGEPDVGKAVAVEGLAQAIVHGDVPETIKDKQVYNLDMGSLMVGSRYRGDFEGRLKEVLKEIRTRGDIVLFIDEIHTLAGAGAAEGSINTAQMLKPMLTRDELRAIGTTTNDEYRKYIGKDAALKRRFQPVEVGEPSVDETVEILRGLCDRYEAHRRVIIMDAATRAAVGLADHYILDRFLPDKAIDLVDEAGMRLRIRRMTAPPELRKIGKKIAEARRNKEATIDDQDFEKAASLRDEGSKLNEERKAKERAWKGGKSDEIAEVGDQEIAEVLAMSTGIPIVRLTQTETAKLLEMEDKLHKRVIGQGEAIRALAQSIRRTRSGLKDPNRPGDSFILAGPTGAGKAELAKAFAEFLFGDEDALIQLDVSEFSEKHTTSRLFGAPPGYAGYDEGGQLMEKARCKPFLVILSDEVKKAHPDIFNSLLQILKEGRLTGSQGRKVGFKNIVIIMTTDLGTRDVNKGVPAGFQATDNSTYSYSRMESEVAEELKQHLRPEFFSHVDDTIMFPPLTKPEISRIADLMIARLVERMGAQDVCLQLTGDTRELLTDMSFDPALGAHPLHCAIQRKIGDVLSKRVLFGELQPGQVVTVSVTGEGKDRAFAFNGE